MFLNILTVYKSSTDELHDMKFIKKKHDKLTYDFGKLITAAHFFSSLS